MAAEHKIPVAVRGLLLYKYGDVTVHHHVVYNSSYSYNKPLVLMLSHHLSGDGAHGALNKLHDAFNDVLPGTLRSYILASQVV